MTFKPKLIENESANEQENGKSLTYGSFEKGVIPPPIRPDERSTELHPYSPGPCTSLSPGGWPPILDLPIFKRIPGSIWFSIKVILFLFLYIWVRAAFPRYRYDQLMGLGRKVFLPLSLARVVAVSGVSSPKMPVRLSLGIPILLAETVLASIACLPLAKKELLRVKSGSKAQTWHAETSQVQTIRGARQGKARADKRIPASSNEGGGGGGLRFSSEYGPTSKPTNPPVASTHDSWNHSFACREGLKKAKDCWESPGRPLPLFFLLDVAISLHIEESRRFVYAQKLARPTAPCYNNEWLVRSISRRYLSTSLHQADPTPGPTIPGQKDAKSQMLQGLGMPHQDEAVALGVILSPLIIYVIGALVVFSVFRRGLVPRLELVDPAVALDSVRDQIQAELLTLFQQRYGPHFVFPPG
ncbi:unnamed protein product [Sphenostylis stenocarpa]|uniref:Uncharacterized protein n=1 Tax=Sphenostylis stenocarpa TaxID=92480 RepID=A0AA86SSW3_9FABA|nr:unnamed protein product [Sphenostylis stenocarpa]